MTVSVISSYPQCNDNPRFTTFKPFCAQKCRKYCCFSEVFNSFISPLLFLRKKCVSHFFRETANENSFKKQKHEYQIHAWSEKAIQGTCCESRIVIFTWRITFTVPLIKEGLVHQFTFSLPKSTLCQFNGTKPE